MMNRLAVVLALVAAGCGSPVDDGSDEVAAVEAGKADLLSQLPAPAAEHLYFDDAVLATLDDNHPLEYRVFAARGGQPFTITAQAWANPDDEPTLDPSRSPGWKLHRLARDARGKLYWKLVDTVDGSQGEAKQSYYAYAARIYLLEVATSALPTNAHISLTCEAADHSACALAGQPHDVCTRSSCDDGLFCQKDSCGAKTGRCAYVPAVCPLFCAPMCGCDGKDYCNPCEAARAGVSIANAAGSCGCDPTVWHDGNPGISGTYTYVSASNDHYTYAFAGRGGVTSTHEAACLFATPFPCKIAIMPKHGEYALDGLNHVVITYDDGATATLTQQQNCKGAVRLVGTDYGAQLTLTP